MAELILHHYDISPYAEKIRLCFGLKRLAWRSVIVPMVLPKPNLMPLTGGFRRTPVLQIGADIYCDTLRIAMELEPALSGAPAPARERSRLRRHRGYLGRTGADVADRALCHRMNRDALSEPFFADRSAMRGHPTPTMAQVAAGLPHQEGQLHLMLGWVEDLLAGERLYAPGRMPRLADFALYQRLWWLKALEGKAAHVLAGYPRMRDWIGRIEAIGHGERSELTPEDALRIASDAAPDPTPFAGSSDGFRPGVRIRVATEDFALDPVEGEIVYVTREAVAIRREDPEVGRVHVHFPRLGYEISAV